MEKLRPSDTQWYCGLKYHYEEAYKEVYGEFPDNAEVSPDYAIFSRSYYRSILDLNHDKHFDFCFIGSIESAKTHREWVIDFAKNRFTDKSIFINTDSPKKWRRLGSFDKTNKEKRIFNPKKQRKNQSKRVQYRVVEENKFYFGTMCNSRFVLCPRGDSAWSFRFYETIMCGSVPVVETWNDTYRSREESKIGYKYLLKKDMVIPSNNEQIYIIDTNREIFEKYHLLSVNKQNRS